MSGKAKALRACIVAATLLTVALGGSIVTKIVGHGPTLTLEFCGEVDSDRCSRRLAGDGSAALISDASTALASYLIHRDPTRSRIPLMSILALLLIGMTYYVTIPWYLAESRRPTAASSATEARRPTGAETQATSETIGVAMRFLDKHKKFIGYFVPGLLIFPIWCLIIIYLKDGVLRNVFFYSTPLAILACFILTLKSIRD